MQAFFVRSLLFALAVHTLGPASVQAQDSRTSIRLRAGDAVRLEVRDEPALLGEYRVDESGRVLLPLVGLIPVAGRDFEDFRHDVDAAFGHQLHDREVRVTPLMRVSVLGEARLPGLYTVDPTMTLSDLLARAGGYGPDANRKHTELVRDGSVIAVVPQTELPRFVQPLVSGDQVVVGRQGWAQRNSGALIGSSASLFVAVLTGLILR